VNEVLVRHNPIFFAEIDFRPVDHPAVLIVRSPGSPGYATCSLSCRVGAKRRKPAAFCRSTSPRQMPH